MSMHMVLTQKRPSASQRPSLKRMWGLGWLTGARQVSCNAGGSSSVTA
jgi:hypothetical protein